MNKIELAKYLDPLFIEVKEDELDKVLSIASELEEVANLINKIDTTNVEPIAFAFDVETTYLREDEITHEFSREELLQNASESEEEFVKFVKVVQ